MGTATSDHPGIYSLTVGGIYSFIVAVLRCHVMCYSYLTRRPDLNSRLFFRPGAIIVRRGSDLQAVQNVGDVGGRKWGEGADCYRRSPVLILPVEAPRKTTHSKPPRHLDHHHRRDRANRNEIRVTGDCRNSTRLRAARNEF